MPPLDCSGMQPLLALLLVLLGTQQVTVKAQNLQLRFDSGELSQCRRLFAVDDDDVPIAEAGFLCLVIEPDVTDTILVNYATSDGWFMNSVSAWFNTNIDDMPARRDEPRVDNFPYQFDAEDSGLNQPLTTYGFQLPLTEAGVPACGVGGGGDGDPIAPLPVATSTSVLGVAYAELYKEDEDGDEVEADGWADGVLPEDPDTDLWTLFNFTIQCVEEPTPAPTLPPTTPAPTNTPPPTPQATPPPIPTPPPVPIPTDPPKPLVADGGMCDDNEDCQSGSCSATGFCLVSTGSPCATDEVCATQACINGICNTCDGGQSSILTKGLMDTSFVAAQLTQSFLLGFQDNPPAVTATNVNFYGSGTNNPSMVGKVNGVCYGVFAPTESQDLATFGTSSISTFQQTCDVHERAQSAYFTDDRQFFELQLAQCASTCATGGSIPSAVGRTGQDLLDITFRNEVITPAMLLQPAALLNDACPIVLTGHGLGGGAALVGSLVLADLQPTVLTFGAPRTVSGNCALLAPTARSQYHYRYVNLAFAPSYNTDLFDSIPQLGDGGSLVHYGNPIMLDEMETIVLPINDDTTRAHVYDNNNSADPTANDGNIPHQLQLYNERIAALNLESCYPIPASDSWQNGHWCDDNDICMSGKCRAFITLGANDYSTGICVQKAGDGEVCVENNDCLSDQCNVGVCLGGAPGSGGGGGGGGQPPPPATPMMTPAPTPDAGGGGGGGGTGTVAPCGPCASNNECQSGVCNTYTVPGAPGGTTSVCAETPAGTMSTGCFCSGNNDDCTDKRCEGDASGQLFLCFSPLPPCQACDEDTDCLSNNCVEGLCGLQSGGLPPDCGGSGGGGNPNPTPPADCSFCTNNGECASQVGPKSRCEMNGVCTESLDPPNDKLALGCACMPPRDGSNPCGATAVCERKNPGDIGLVCVDSTAA